MPTLVATAPIYLGALSTNNTFDGLILLRVGHGWASVRSRGVGSARNIAISIENGVIVAAHQVDRLSPLHELSLPVSLEPSQIGLDYWVGWMAGQPKALRADMAVLQDMQRQPRTYIELPSVSTIEIASLFGLEAEPPGQDDVTPPNVSINDGGPVENDTTPPNVSIDDGGPADVEPPTMSFVSGGSA